MIRFGCAGVFNWMRQKACMSLSGSLDGCQWMWMAATDCIFYLLWWRWRRRRLQTTAQGSFTICSWGRTLETVWCKTCNGGLGVLAGFCVTASDSPRTLHPSLFLYSLGVMGTDGWQLLAVSLGSPVPPSFSTAPGLLQLMAWLQRLRQNSNAAPISLSLFLSLSKLRGYRVEGRWWEIAGAVGGRITADGGEML